jgi:hypothetical protein
MKNLKNSQGANIHRKAHHRVIKKALEFIVNWSVIHKRNV